MLENYEEFTEEQLRIIERYVTNTSASIFVLRNLPEVIKGALFSRYSRSSSGLRSLLLKEFILNEETAFPAIASLRSDGDAEKEQSVAIKKAQGFYDRILDGYGDDSIGELGGAHLAIECVSMLAAKAIEDSRIGGSPLEKSTRYVYFDQKYSGEYLFFRESILMTSAYRDIYIDTCNRLFETYGELIPPMTARLEERFPKEHDVSKVAYGAALRAKALDCLRGILPASALTNVGIYGNGRFFENLMQKLFCSSLNEVQEVAKGAYRELSKVIPSFIRRADPNHKHSKSFSEFREKMHGELQSLAQQYVGESPVANGSARVSLVHYDPDSPIKVAAALLFPHSDRGLHELQEIVQNLSEEERDRIFEASSAFRENRRHKSPRALEHAQFTFEIVADFGIYRDLQRHRILTQDRQLLKCDFGYFIPQEILGTDMEKRYREVMNRARDAYEEIAVAFPEEAQYVVPMAYNIRWYFHVNLRALQWICELRSSSAGHPNYRYVARAMFGEVVRVLPEFRRFFKFVDHEQESDLGRLGQEVRIAEKFKQSNA